MSFDFKKAAQETQRKIHRLKSVVSIMDDRLRTVHSQMALRNAEIQGLIAESESLQLHIKECFAELEALESAGSTDLKPGT